MIFLGEFKAGASVFYAANFHNDTGTLEDPTSPEAQIRNSAGTWSALTAPAKQNTKTGHFGGTVDTTGFSVGQHVIRMAGTVATAKTVATEFCFMVVANIESDTYAVVAHASYGNAQLVRSTTPANTLDVSTTGEVGLDFANIKQATGATTLNNVTVPTVTNLTNAPLDSSGVTTLLSRIASALTITTGKVDVNDKTGFSLTQAFPTNFAALSISATTGLVDITQTAADKVWSSTIRTLSSFGTLVSDIWAYSTRTLTAFSNVLALSVWDVLESAIVTASSIGLKVKTNLDSTVSAVKAKTDNLPADPASNTQVNTRLATSGYTAPDNTSITAIKAKTDTISWQDITDTKDGTLGKWSINKTTNVLTMYKADGVTVLKTFNLTDNASVSERVPV